MSKVHYDDIKAPTKSIPKEDMMDDPADLDMLSRFLYQVSVHERLTTGSMDHRTIGPECCNEKIHIVNDIPV